jgi:hypothetical protein
MLRSLGSFARVVWRVVPEQAPRALRRCPRCDVDRPFVSSEKIRVNAQQHRIDVWLIYKCCVCDATWNRSLARRATVAELGAETYARYLANDRETARAWAHDVAHLAASGVRVDASAEYRVERDETVLSAPLEIEIRVAMSFDLRLDRLLAQELAVSRSALIQAVRSGTIHVGGGERALKRRVADGQIVVLAGAYLPEAARELSETSAEAPTRRSAFDRTPY